MTFMKTIKKIFPSCFQTIYIIELPNRLNVKSIDSVAIYIFHYSIFILLAVMICFN